MYKSKTDTAIEKIMSCCLSFTIHKLFYIWAKGKSAKPLIRQLAANALCMKTFYFLWKFFSFHEIYMFARLLTDSANLLKLAKWVKLYFSHVTSKVILQICVESRTIKCKYLTISFVFEWHDMTMNVEHVILYSRVKCNK